MVFNADFLSMFRGVLFSVMYMYIPTHTHAFRLLMFETIENDEEEKDDEQERERERERARAREGKEIRIPTSIKMYTYRHAYPLKVKSSCIQCKPKIDML
jgi:hypothetical protein